MISRERLEAWLIERAKTDGVLVGAVYDGLLTRMRRGDFDETDQEIDVLAFQVTHEMGPWQFSAGQTIQEQMVRRALLAEREVLL